MVSQCFGLASNNLAMAPNCDAMVDLVLMLCCALQDEWYGRAELALRNGKEDLAREALERRQSNQVCFLSHVPPLFMASSLSHHLVIANRTCQLTSIMQSCRPTSIALMKMI